MKRKFSAFAAFVCLGACKMPMVTGWVVDGTWLLSEVLDADAERARGWRFDEGYLGFYNDEKRFTFDLRVNPPFGMTPTPASHLEGTYSIRGDLIDFSVEDPGPAQ